MCGICGAINLRGEPIPDLGRASRSMSDLIAHRGPDDAGVWDARARPRRLRPPPARDHRPRRPAHQPMTRRRGQLDHLQRRDLQLPRAARRARRGSFRTDSRHRGRPARLRPLGRGLRSTTCAACSPSRSGTSARQTLFCARDRFGIKPFYYAPVGDVLYFASEAKALLPFLPAIETDLEGLKDYLAFQFCLAGKTLFEGVQRAAARPLPARPQRHGRDRALLGGLLRPRLRPHGELLRGADRGAAATTRSRSTCAATCRSARTSAAASTRASSRRSPATPRTDAPEGVHRPVPRGRALRRERATRATLADARGLRPARDRHRRRATSSSTIERRHLPPRLPGRRAGLVPAVHGLRRPPRASARWCSAARAATRSSAATRAT